MVLTRPEYRRQGLARRLLDDALATADRRGLATLKLDATEEGRPLYESLGFIVEGRIERWVREGESNFKEGNDGHRHPLSEQHFNLDIEAFGTSRKELLESLSNCGSCNTASDGFVLSRPGRTTHYLGPCVAKSGIAAMRLIAAHLERNVGATGWYWDLLPSNLEAVRCAESLGFTRRRVLWRMRRGSVIETNDAMVYAIAGFELG
jgi:hypothetical protein